MPSRYSTTRRRYDIEVEMESSLSVREADEFLFELAGGGHLTVGREGGAPVYALLGSLGKREAEGS